MTNTKAKQIIILSLLAITLCGCSKVAQIDLINGPDPILYIATEGENGNIVFIESSQLATPIKQTKLVVFTHGWFDMVGWPKNVAASLHKKLPNDTWAVGWFDWRGDTTKVLPTEVAYHGKYKDGPFLGDELLRLTENYEHVHLIGHSCGSWVINETAKKIAKQTDANIHLTFLDAFVPILWDRKELGSIDVTDDAILWSDHYLNHDVDTLSQTELTLKNAHNVDITKADPDMPDHDFVWNWYWATIEETFEGNHEYPDATLYYTAGKIEYGYRRSLEAGIHDWSQNSTNFPHGNTPVMIDAPKKEFKLPLQDLIEKTINKQPL